MIEMKQRLEAGVAILAKLDRKRRDTRMPQLGYDAEYLIIHQELRQLESDIMADPGALKSFVVRNRGISPTDCDNQQAA